MHGYLPRMSMGNDVMLRLRYAPRSGCRVMSCMHENHMTGSECQQARHCPVKEMNIFAFIKHQDTGEDQ